MSPRPNHILHLLLSVITGGLWLPVWLILSMRYSLSRAGTMNWIVGALAGIVILIYLVQ
jgi:carbon starvation protein CstA